MAEKILGGKMKAKKLKIYVKTARFSFPIPALHFSTLRWISKAVLKCCPSKMRSGWMPTSSEYENLDSILKNITSEDIAHILEHLEQEEPFEMVDIETYDENKQKVVVKIYTI